MLQVREKNFDLKLLTCELFWSQIVVADVVRNGFLRDVLVVGVKLRGEESRNSFYCGVYRGTHFYLIIIDMNFINTIY